MRRPPARDTSCASRRARYARCCLQKATSLGSEVTTATTSAVEDLVRSIYRLGLVQRSIARHALAELGSQGFTALAIVQRAGHARVSEVADQLSVDLSV